MFLAQQSTLTNTAATPAKSCYQFATNPGSRNETGLTNNRRKSLSDKEVRETGVEPARVSPLDPKSHHGLSQSVVRIAFATVQADRFGRSLAGFAFRPFCRLFLAWAAFGPSGRLSDLLSGVRPSASGATRTPFLLRRLGLRPCVRVSGCFWADCLPEPTEEPGTNADHPGSATTVRLVPSRPTLSTCLGLPAPGEES